MLDYYVLKEIAAELRDRLGSISAARRSVLVGVVGLFAVAIFVALVSMFSGGNGLRRYRLSGTCKFHGQPVASGTISFTAVRSGVKHSGYAAIREGVFDTSIEGVGHVGGAQNYTVIGFAEALGGEFEEDAAPPALFEPIEWRDSLPSSAAVLDVDLPR